MFTIFDPKTPINFVSKMKVTSIIGISLVVISLGLLAVRGINWGIDFSGGTELQVKFSKQVGSEEIRKVLTDAGFKKKQVQRYGTEEQNEMLIRIERLTSMKDEDVAKIRGLFEAELSSLSPGAKTQEVRVDFSKDEGDKITLFLPVPTVAGPGPSKNSDLVAVKKAIETALGVDDNKQDLTDAAIDLLSNQGFDRAAIAKVAMENGYPMTASFAKQREPAFNADLALDRLVQAQEKKVIQILDQKSGYKLRRTKAGDDAKETTDDAVVRDDPYQGKVKYLVHFEGVSKEIIQSLEKQFGEVELRRVDFVDAKVAEQLRTDGFLAVLLALLCILIYVAVRFDIFFSPGAVIALLHDAVVALIVYPLFQMEFDLPSVAAVLTVVGYSINNTIVIFDRIREVMPDETKGLLSMDAVRGHVNQAINDTFSRTINTTLTTLFASSALFFLAGGVVKNFAAILSIGILLGAFSSTFLAPASYLFFRARKREDTGSNASKGGLSREDKARGVV